jgi:chromosome segregation protein
VFLKRLVLKGFKSFAERTELEFEPGVTVVVGPNGSGKSNIVDAVAWVLGAQGARALRGAKMDDVIFAGTEKRPALGRAEVELTIDNSAGLLPIEFSEVTVSRTLFRTGESEYRLNGVPCRLLDITDLLSDSGIGRSQHVIIGQGQLDSVLTSRPEERRAIVEEAAGILKFRKRKERAERRLEATEANLLRLNDLLREVRRQLRPLERQAEAARRHDGIRAELRAIQLHLAGRDLDRLQVRLDRQRDERARLGASIAELGARLRALDLEVVDAEHALAGPTDDDDAELLARAEALRHRAGGLAALVAERRRGIERELEAVADEGVVASLVADAAAVRERLADVDADFASLAPSRAEVEAAEARVAALRSSVEQAATVPSDATAEGAARLEAERALEHAEARRRAADAELHRWRARAEALALALAEAHEAAGIAALDGLDGLVGPLVDLVEIEPGAQAAVAAVLGDALRAVVVDGEAAAVAAVERLKAGDAGALLLVAAGTEHHAQTRLVPPGCRPLADLVRTRVPALDAVIARLLDGAVLVDGDWRAALAVSDEGLVAVTADGDLFGGRGIWCTGARDAGGVTRQALTEAEERAGLAEQDAADAVAAVAAARAALDDARTAERKAQERQRAERAELERLRAAAAKLRRDFEVRGAEIEERRAGLSRRLAEIEQRLAARPDEEAAAHRRRVALDARAAAARDIEERLAARLGDIERLAERFHARRRARTQAARDAGRRLEGLRRERAELERQLAQARERHGRAEVEEAELALRIETAVDALRRDFDCEPGTALAAAAPDVPDGVTLAQRARELERELRLMGPVNPLALSEYEALQERHAFLEAQLDDVKTSRRELHRVIRAVDAEIVAVFEQAFADVARHFGDLFATLFPGGAGRLVLTEPADLLRTGIEIEARPSGKTPRRLSLLSGGERSLTALAFLFAVFRARPSPFYMMDEVEAALDDMNLHRFLDLLAEFRREAQLLVVSHQKRTMEAADVLYGVSMPPGGTSRVVSQRLHEVELEAV